MRDPIDRQAAIDALWKSLHAYEDKTERQFIESDELDVGDWMEHRIFVQNMNDIDRQTILELPSSDAVDVVRCKDCKHRPTGESRDDLEFPDDKCPCKCEDYWYSWKPSDNWFCGNGERKDSNYRGERKYG